MNPPRIAITGMGAVCALGTGIEAISAGLLAGRRGLHPSTNPALPYGPQVFGQVDADNTVLGSLLEGRVQTLPRSRTALLALLAAKEAVAGFTGLQDTAVISASTVGGMDLSETRYAAWAAGEASDLQDVHEHPVGSHTTYVARMLGSRALRTTISTACSSSANALAMGAELLLAGESDRVLAGGADALCRFTVEGFRALGAMDTAPVRPFSGDRAGMNLGEGAAYLILEREDDAARAGRTPLALLAGWCNSNDAHHQTATSPDGAGPYRAMAGALRMAGATANDVDHINAHGTGTDNNDGTELAAMERLFPVMPPFTSTKGSTGHTLGAAGALEAVIAIICMREGIIPASPNPIVPMAGHRSGPVTSTLRRPVRNVLSSSFGFGGNDTALYLTSPRP